MDRRALLAATSGVLLAGCGSRASTTTTTGTANEPAETAADLQPEIRSVRDGQLTDAGFELEFSVDKRATEHQPALVRATLRNVAEAVRDLEFVGAAPLGRAIYSTESRLLLAPARQDSADKSGNELTFAYVFPSREGPCWRSVEYITIQDRTTVYRLHPGEAVSNTHNLIAYSGEQCPPAGEYEFIESELLYRRQDSDEISRLSWGVSLYYPGRASSPTATQDR